MKRGLPILAGLLLAAGHFAACLGIVPLTLRVGGALAGGPADSILYAMLARATKVLYFPILSLALYPRHWFPGSLIAIPIAVNSLLWGTALGIAIWLGRRLGARRRG